MEDFQHFRVYQDARQLTRDVWKATRGLPWCVQRTLVPQLDNACESIGANIAEGCGRKNRHHGNAELIRYLHFSFGSANEVEHRLGGLADREILQLSAFEELNPRVIEIKRKLRLWNSQLYRLDRGRRGPLESGG